MKRSKKLLLSALSLSFVVTGAMAITQANTAYAQESEPLANRLTNAEYLAENFFVDGTSVRVATATHTPAKRHHLIVSDALYEELSQLENVTIGVGFIPEQLLTDGSLDVLDVETVGANFTGVVYDSATGKDGFNDWKEDNTKKEGLVSLTDIAEKDFAVNIVYRGFIKVGEDYYYTAQPKARSMSWVARQEYENPETLLDATQIESLKTTYLDLGYTVSFDGGEEQSVIYGDNVSALAPEVSVEEGYVLKGWYNQAKTYKWDMENGEVVGNTKLYSVQMQDTFVEDFAQEYSKTANFLSTDKVSVNSTSAWLSEFNDRTGVLSTKGEKSETQTEFYFSSEYSLEALEEKFASYEWGGLTISAYVDVDGSYTVNFGNNEENNPLTQTINGQEWVELKISRNTAKNKGLENVFAENGDGVEALFAIEGLPEDVVVYVDGISFSEKQVVAPENGVVQSFDGYSAGIRKKTDTVREDTATVEYLDTWDGRTGVARDIGADKYANFYVGASVEYQEFVDEYGLALDETTNTYDMQHLDYISIWIWVEKLEGQADTVKLVNGKVSWTVPREEWYELKLERENFLLSTETTGTAGKYNYTLQSFCYTLSYDTVSMGTSYLFYSDGLVEGTYPDTSPNTRVYFDEIKFVMHDTSNVIQSFDDKDTSLRKYASGSLSAQSTMVYKETWDGRTGVVGDYSHAGDAYGNFYVSSHNTYDELLYKSENLKWNYISTWIWIDKAGTFTLVSGKLKYTVTGQAWQELRFGKDDFCVSANNESGKLRTTLNNFLSGISSNRQGNEYIFYCDALKNSEQVYVYFDEMSFIYDDSYVFESFSLESSKAINSTSTGKTEQNSSAEWMSLFNGKTGVLKTQGEFFNNTAFNSTTASTKTSFHISSNTQTTAVLEPMLVGDAAYDYVSIVLYIDKAGEYTVDFATSSATSSVGAQVVQGQQWVEVKVDMSLVGSTLRYVLSYNNDNANNNNRNRRPLFSIKNLSADTVEALPETPDVWVYIDEIKFCNNTEA